MHTIMVGFDGSAASFVAADWAAERAARGRTRVELVRVDPGAMMADDNDMYAFTEAERRIHDVASEAEVTSTVVMGRMPGSLVSAAQHADVLVIGSHPHRPLRTALTGWRQLRAIARSTVPIAVVPDYWTAGDGPVVVGVDDDDSSVTAIDFAAAEADAAGVDLTVVHAWQMPPPMMDGSVAVLASPLEEKAAHRRILDEACSRVAEEHPRLVVSRVLIRVSPATALLFEASVASLLVLGTHHRGVVEGTFLGSVTREVLRELSAPLCVVPARSDASAHGSDRVTAG